jgi:DNA-binding transcriptional regulator YiaG
MSKDKLNIDTDIWITQQALATELNTSVQRVHNWIKRGKISAKYVKEINLTLVDRTSVNIKTVVS